MASEKPTMDDPIKTALIEEFWMTGAERNGATNVYGTLWQNYWNVTGELPNVLDDLNPVEFGADLDWTTAEAEWERNLVEMHDAEQVLRTDGIAQIGEEDWGWIKSDVWCDLDAVNNGEQVMF